MTNDADLVARAATLYGDGSAAVWLYEVLGGRYYGQALTPEQREKILDHLEHGQNMQWEVAHLRQRELAQLVVEKGETMWKVTIGDKTAIYDDAGGYPGKLIAERLDSTPPETRTDSVYSDREGCIQIGSCVMSWDSSVDPAAICMSIMRGGVIHVLRTHTAPTFEEAWSTLGAVPPAQPPQRETIDRMTMAKALHKAWCGSPPVEVMDWDDESEPNRAGCLAMADAALSAFRAANPGRATVRAVTAEDVWTAYNGSLDWNKIAANINQRIGFGLAQAEGER